MPVNSLGWIMTEKLTIFLMLLFYLTTVAGEEGFDSAKVKKNAEEAFSLLDGKCDDACMKSKLILLGKNPNLFCQSEAVSDR